MDNNLFPSGKSGILSEIEKQVFKINWDNTLPIYETLNFKYDSNKSITKDVGIIIDNGSYECRAGWSFSDLPNIRVRSLVAKPKVPNKQSSLSFLVGNEMLSIEQGKLHKKSPFEKNIISHFGTQEHILDHIFWSLKITDTEVNHPILITEPFCNLNYSRKNLTEMLFELYSVPSMCYATDMLLSLYQNQNEVENALIISSSYQTTHVVPFLHGKVDYDRSRRISVGGFHNAELLTKSLHLKYPELKTKLTNELIQHIQENYTMCAKDYQKQLRLLEEVFKYDQDQLKEEEKMRMFGSLEMYEKAYYEENAMRLRIENQYSHLKVYKNMVEYNNELYEKNTHDDVIYKLVFFEWPKISSQIVLTEEELRNKQEMRKEQSRRLREIMQKKREENMKNLEKELQELERISMLREKDKYQFEEALLSIGYSSNEELQKRISKIRIKIDFNQETKEEEKIDEEKRWPLLNIPDEDLNEDQIKLKRIHKMQKNAYLSRLEKRELAKREKERVEELKQKDPEKYLISLYKKKKELLDRFEKYKQIRKDLTNRHSKANIKRMMVLAELSKDSEKTQGKKKTENVEDEFGINDEDWEVYRRHNLSEEEEEDQQHLNEIEAQIVEMDPNYFKYSENLTQGYMYGTQFFSLGVDQFRGPELLFKPYLIGIDQAGITEIILSIFKTLPFEDQKNLAENIFITGGNSKTMYIEERIRRDLRSSLHCDIDINVWKAKDPELDAWKGGMKFFNESDNQRYFMTKSDYYEYGPDYFKEHFCSNTSFQKNTIAGNMHDAKSFKI